MNFAWYSSSTLGTRNASVFPEPVRAAPRTSLPASKGGIVRAWTSVIVSYPIVAMPAIVGFESESDANVLSLRIPSTWTTSAVAAGSVRSRAAASSSSSSFAPASSSSASSSLAASFAAAAAAAAAAFSSRFFLIFRIALRSFAERPSPSSASSRSRFFAAFLIFFFRARSAASSSGDMPDVPMVDARVPQREARVGGNGSRRNRGAARQ